MFTSDQSVQFWWKERGKYGTMVSGVQAESLEPIILFSTLQCSLKFLKRALREEILLWLGTTHSSWKRFCVLINDFATKEVPITNTRYLTPVLHSDLTAYSYESLLMSFRFSFWKILQSSLTKKTSNTQAPPCATSRIQQRTCYWVVLFCQSSVDDSKSKNQNLSSISGMYKSCIVIRWRHKLCSVANLT